jgi:acyl-coenzyme A thioesterase PaaI-like protein
MFRPCYEGGVVLEATVTRRGSKVEVAAPLLRRSVSGTTLACVMRDKDEGGRGGWLAMGVYRECNMGVGS